MEHQFLVERNNPHEFVRTGPQLPKPARYPFPVWIHFPSETAWAEGWDNGELLFRLTRQEMNRLIVEHGGNPAEHILDYCVCSHMGRLIE